MNDLILKNLFQRNPFGKISTNETFTLKCLNLKRYALVCIMRFSFFSIADFDIKYTFVKNLTVDINYK